ncbi:MAG: hypothetical protein ACLRW4_17165 [Ruminococcus sp.]
MLHILWILIKFILIILGILLGLALLAVLLLLFCPVRYQARAVKESRQLQGDRTGSQNYLAVPRHRRQVLLS